MSAMHYKGYPARVEFDDEDGIFVGRVAGIVDVVTFHADNVDDLRAAFHEAVDDYLDTCAKIGKSPQKSFTGNLTLRIDPAVHASAAMAAALAGKSLNQWGEEALDKAARELVK
jgi:predicted HicB family RNase H-like nuclease